MADAQRDEYYQRGKIRYIRAHAHQALGAAVEFAPHGGAASVATCAVALTAALYDALPPEPDAAPSSPGAMESIEAALLNAGMEVRCPPVPAEPEDTTRAAHKAALRQRIGRMATCQDTCDPDVVETYHRYLTHCGVKICTGCGKAVAP